MKQTKDRAEKKQHKPDSTKFNSYLNNYIRATLFIIPLVITIVSITLYVGDKPDRSQVREMINDSVHLRITRLESQLNEIQQDIKLLLQSKHNFLNGEQHED